MESESQQTDLSCAGPSRASRSPKRGFVHTSRQYSTSRLITAAVTSPRPRPTDRTHSLPAGVVSQRSRPPSAVQLCGEAAGRRPREAAVRPRPLCPAPCAYSAGRARRRDGVRRSARRAPIAGRDRRRPRRGPPVEHSAGLRGHDSDEAGACTGRRPPPLPGGLRRACVRMCGCVAV